MNKRPTDYEFQILANQIDIMGALLVLLSHVAYDDPIYEKLVAPIADLIEEAAENTKELLGVEDDE